MYTKMYSKIYNTYATNSKYYCLIASLPELSLDDGKLTYTVGNFKKEIYPELSNTDKKLVDLFYLTYDNENLLALLKNKDAELHPLGNYTKEQFTDLMRALKDGEKFKSPMPSYFTSFITYYWQLEESGDTTRPEDILASYYYDYAMSCTNKFVATWFELNLNINNILVALTARKHKMNIAKNVVGNSSVCKAIRESSARDFGLSADLDYFDQLAHISDMTELMEREKKTDLLKWNWLEEATFFNYFTIERIIAFLLRLSMIERWISLDKEKGSELFRQIIEKLKNDVQIPEEFRK